MCLASPNYGGNLSKELKRIDWYCGEYNNHHYSKIPIRVRLCIYLYGVGLVMLDSLSTPQCPGEGKLFGGWAFISFLWSISWALFSFNGLILLDFHLSHRVPLWVLCWLLFLFLLLFPLSVGISFSLAVLCQLKRKRGSSVKDNKYTIKVKTTLVCAKVLFWPTFAPVASIQIFNWR